MAQTKKTQKDKMAQNKMTLSPQKLSSKLGAKHYGPIRNDIKAPQFNSEKDTQQLGPIKRFH